MNCLRLLEQSGSCSVILTRLSGPFQTHDFSENFVAPGIEPGTSGSVGRNSGHKTTEALIIIIIIIIIISSVV
jgi:hypothetical protein